jgi:hypothetical protein
MKKLTIFICSLSLSMSLIHAQDKFKFGSVPDDLLRQTVYEKDTSATAYVVYEDCNVNYQWNTAHANFERVMDYVVRIKILKQAGTDQANGSVSFYKGKTTAASERLTGLAGFTYNYEGGKIVKDKLEKQYINNEVVTERMQRTKFALPAAKAGSVIEYKYSIASPYYNTSINYKFQRAIPVKYSRFSIVIPQYFVFNKEIKGYEPQKTNVTQTNVAYPISGQGVLQCSAEQTVSETFDLPALKDEAFVWNYNDYKTGINLELKRVSIPGVYYKEYSQTWNNVADWLNKADNYGKRLDNKSILKEETEAIRNGDGDSEAKLRAVLDLVRSRVKWNGTANLLIENDSKALKEGVGSSAEVNAILFNALRNTGFYVLPVAIRLRSSGRLPITYPSIDDLDYFIVQVTEGDKIYYMDATKSYTDLNVLPPDCLVEQALVLYPDKFAWEDLTKIGSNTYRTNMLLEFNEDGFLKGQYLKNHSGECAYLFKKALEDAKNEEEYIEKAETDRNIDITDFKMEEKRGANYACGESFNFTANGIQAGENNIVMFRPMLFETMSTNPFKAETRKLPVEYSFPADDRINVSIFVPKDYVVDALPQSAKYSYGENNEIEFMYVVKESDNMIRIICQNKVNVSIIPSFDYGMLRDFMSKVYAKCQEMIVLKKAQ